MTFCKCKHGLWGRGASRGPQMQALAIVIYIRVRDVNFPAQQLVSGTMAQPSA
jgi:hypothetical protein